MKPRTLVPVLGALLATTIIGACTSDSLGAAPRSAGPGEPPSLTLIGAHDSLTIAPSAWTLYERTGLLAGAEDAVLDLAGPEAPDSTTVETIMAGIARFAAPDDAPLDLVLGGPGRVALNEVAWTDLDAAPDAPPERVGGTLTLSSVPLSDGELAGAFSLPPTGGRRYLVTLSLTVSHEATVRVASYDFIYRRDGAAE